MKRIYSLICGIVISFVIGFTIGNLLEAPYSFIWMFLITVILAPFWFVLVHFVSNKRYKNLVDKRCIEICIIALIIFYSCILTRISFVQGYSILATLIFSIGFIGGIIVFITRITIFLPKSKEIINDEANDQKSDNHEDEE